MMPRPYRNKAVKECADHYVELKKEFEEQRDLIDVQNNLTEQQDERIKEFIISLQKEELVVEDQELTNKSIKKTINSLYTSTKPLIYLHRCILIDGFRLYMMKKYSKIHLML